MNWLQKLFLDYEGIDLTHTEQVKGATQAEISSLERISGEILPTDYRLFLEICGKKLPNFIDTSDISFEIDDLIEQYKITLEEDPDEIPKSKFIIIAIWDMTGADWVLHTPTGEVYSRNEYGEILSKVTDDFKKIIHQYAFTYYKLNKSKYVKSFGSSASNLNKKYGCISVDQIYKLVLTCLKKHNLSLLDISDIHKQCASGDNIYFTNTLYISEIPNEKIKNINAAPFQIGSNVEDDLIKLAQDMNNLIGME